MSTAVRESERRAGAPDAWAVWGAWRASAGQIAAIARQVNKHLGSDECIIEVDVGGSPLTIPPEHVESDLAPRYRRSFRRMLITGSTPERRIDAEFDNERVRTPGRGVVLRVWSHDPEDAIAVRDSLAVAIDGGRPPLGGAPKTGPPSDQSADEALVEVERDYRRSIALVGFYVATFMVIVASLLRFFLDPTSELAEILLFCLCGAWKVGAPIFVAVMTFAVWVLAPQIFPLIEISNRSTASRVGGRLLGLLGTNVGLAGAVKAIAQNL